MVCLLKLPEVLTTLLHHFKVFDNQSDMCSHLPLFSGFYGYYAYYKIDNVVTVVTFINLTLLHLSDRLSVLYTHCSKVVSGFAIFM